MTLTGKDKQFLLKLSRKALIHIFETGKELTQNNSDIPDKYKEKKATFVTLTKNGQLRGCIGKLVPQLELYRDIITNTYSAAFNDPRFPQLTEEELLQIKIEISILSEPKVYNRTTPEELLRFLSKEKSGVILEMGLHSATFLPQVWKELETPREFLSQLCLKACLPQDMWKNNRVRICTYKVENFSEK
ncbi:MAG: AmmeMemoRadiSam system protein A [Candidatus Dojkabacteria bacterium]|jgi:AmmeMemoRadiSam system protein A|nr:AmmeMemoRadiSam system protein A [Candidatus Dojkabacteria bacterium]